MLDVKLDGTALAPSASAHARSLATAARTANWIILQIPLSPGKKNVSLPEKMNSVGCPPGALSPQWMMSSGMRRMVLGLSSCS
jgi:hypothetical protein